MTKILILTPVKNATDYLDGYFERLRSLTFPHRDLSVGLLESDSDDDTFEALQTHAASQAAAFGRIGIFKHDFGFHMPAGVPRWEPAFQIARRTTLARSRNQLLFRALGDEDWVLWLDVDVIDDPPDLIETLLAWDCDILHPDCVREPGGPSFDRNAWKDDGRLHLDDLRGSGKPVRIDSVGGTVLLVKADLHRDGLIFPPYRYGIESPRIRKQHPLWGRGEIETEGFAAMAMDMGVQCWGLPDLQVVHA